MILLDGNSLTLKAIRQVVDGDETVGLDPAARARVIRSREIVDKAARSNEKVYAINTGFGILSKIKIAPDQLEELQVNLIRSHCAGVGEPHPERESRAMVLLRANVLAKGFSGVRPVLIETLIGMVNERVHPVIPKKGSVGCSGDLAPLSHLASVLIGEGEAFYKGERLPGEECLKRAGITPVKLAAKEGLSLTNGTQQMTAMAALLLMEAEELVELSDLICCASLEGILGTHRAFSEWLHDTRPYPGQVASAGRMRSYMKDSEIYQSHVNCDRVQDPYSVRCAPQVHGSVRDLFNFVRQTVTTEINSATDNPLVNPDTGEIVSGGNFHGQPLAFALDILGMGLAELGSIGERRIAKLVNPVFSELPNFLTKDEGLNNGFMIAQYTAAHLVVENRILTHPASTDSIPTNNDKEDHNSMGPVAAHKAKTILENLRYILAIEALVACQALEFRKPLKPGRGSRFLYDEVRALVPSMDKDRYLNIDIEKITKLIATGRLYQKLEQAHLGDAKH